MHSITMHFWGPIGSSTGFMDLPLELRQQIYEYAWQDWASSQRQAAQSVRAFQNRFTFLEQATRITRRMPVTGLPTWLLLSKQIYYEGFEALDRTHLDIFCVNTDPVDSSICALNTSSAQRPHSRIVKYVLDREQPSEIVDLPILPGPSLSVGVNVCHLELSAPDNATLNILHRHDEPITELHMRWCYKDRYRPCRNAIPNSPTFESWYGKIDAVTIRLLHRDARVAPPDEPIDVTKSVSVKLSGAGIEEYLGYEYHTFCLDSASSRYRIAGRKAPLGTYAVLFEYMHQGSRKSYFVEYDE